MSDHGYPGRRLPRLEARLRRCLVLSATEARATLRSRRLALECGYVCEAVPDRDAALRHAASRRGAARAA